MKHLKLFKKFETLDWSKIDQQDISAKTEVFENSEIDKGVLSKINKDILQNEVDDIFMKRVIQYFETHGLKCIFLEKMNGPGSKSSLKCEIGGVKVVIEDRDHIRPWLNNALITKIFEEAIRNGTYGFSTMLKFIRFYKEHNLHLLVNKKLQSAASIGVFDK